MSECDPSRFDRLLVRHFDGDSSAAEVQDLSRLIREDPGNTFRQLFIDGSPREVAREAEQSLQRSQPWATKPKPKVDYKLPPVIPSQNEVNERESLWYDIVRLALQTDSTRVIQLTLTEVGHAKLEGFTAAGHHDVSHHGKDPAKIEQLALVEEAELKQFNRFLSLLKQTRESDSTLLDQTVVISASNLGNASAHTGDNLPILLAGGGFPNLATLDLIEVELPQGDLEKLQADLPKVQITWKPMTPESRAKWQIWMEKAKRAAAG